MTYSELNEMGAALVAIGDFTGATNAFYQAHQLIRERPIPCLNIGICQIALKEYKTAKDWLEYAKTLDPNHPTIHLKLGECLMNLEEEGAAVSAYQKSLELDPRSIEALSALAHYFKDEFKISAAADFASQALLLDEDYPLLNAIMANYWYELNDFHKALFHVEKEISNGTASYVDYDLAGNILSALGRYEDATNYYSYAIDQESSGVALDAIASMAYAKSKLGDLDYAVEALTDMFDIDLPYLVKLYYATLAECYLDHKHYVKVLGVAEEARGREASDIVYENRLSIAESEALLCLGRAHDAIDRLMEALDKDNLNAKLYWKLGEILYHYLQNIPEATEAYKRAIDLDSDKATYLMSLALLYRYEEEWELARPLYEKANIMQPHSSETLFGLALYEKEHKNYPQAINYLQQMLEIDPDSAPAHNGLGDCYEVFQQYERAERHHLKSYDLADGWIMPFYSTGKFYQTKAEEYGDPNHLLALQNYQKAKRFYLEGLVKEPDFALFHLQLAKMPSEAFSVTDWNPLGHLLAAMFYAEKNRYNHLVISGEKHTIVERLLNFDLALAPLHFIRDVASFYDESKHISVELERLNKLTEPFRSLFYLVDEETVKAETLSAIAILHYRLGDPIGCYRIYRDVLADSSKKAVDHYYFSRSADMILAAHNGYFMEVSLPFVKGLLSSECSTTDAYYAAEVLRMAGKDDEADQIHAQLLKLQFLPSTLLMKLHQEASLEAFSSLLQTDLSSVPKDSLTGYFRTPWKIELDLTLPMLRQLEGLIHYTEIREMTGELEGDFFARMINIPQLDEVHREDFIKMYFPNKHQVLYGSIASQEWVQRKINAIKANHWSAPAQLLAEIGDEIHMSAISQLDDLQKDVKNFRRINYKNYIFLATELQQANLLDVRTKSIMQHYTIYCAKAVDAFTPESILRQPIVEEVLEKVDQLAMVLLNMPLLNILSARELLMGFYFRKYGKEREILALQDFMASEWPD